MPDVERTSIAGVTLLRTAPTRDRRGWFVRTYDRGLFRELGFRDDIVQENQSRSRRGTLRGLHVRTDLTENKTVRVLGGALYDVVVDLRPWSVTFLQHVAFELSAQDRTIVLIPPGCAHGFLALSDDTDVLYQVTVAYDAELDLSLAWDDPWLAIPWPEASPTLSDRDRRAPRLAEVEPRLEQWFGPRPPGS